MITLTLLEALTAIRANKGKIVAFAKVDSPSIEAIDIPVGGVNIKVVLRLGVCRALSGAVGEEWYPKWLDLRRQYAYLLATAISHPVPAPSDWLDYPACAAEKAFALAYHNEMWGDAEYAENRWAFIEWCIEQLEAGTVL